MSNIPVTAPVVGADGAASALEPASGKPAPSSAGSSLSGKVEKGGWSMIIILTIVYIVSFLDRGAISLIIGPMKADLNASDFEVSLLVGLSFMLLYTVLGIPAGYLVDKFRRKSLLGGAIVFWSGMQVACGLSSTYIQMFLARTGLGIGEAVLPPAASSMIRDAFPLERRGIAFSIYNMGPNLGSGLALVLGGALLAFAAGGGLEGVPFFSGLKPWQFVLIVPGLMGFVLAILVFCMHEPKRRVTPTMQDAVSYGDAIRYAWKNRGAYLTLWVAIALYGIGIGGQFAWLPEAITRATDVPLSVIGKTLGMISIVATPLGLIFWGTVVDYCSGRGMKNAPLKVGQIGTGLAALATASFLFIDDLTIGAVAFGAQMFFYAIFAVAGGATMANITPSNMMGKLTALYYLLTNLFGLALGPSVIALVAGAFEGPRAIGTSYVVCYVVCFVVAIILLGFSARVIERNKMGETA
ncbi:MAG: MFS transporter [Pusillimonas sp.]